MKRLNLYFGILLFIVFLFSGQYMELYFKPANLNNLPLRMEIRANHIYILFISLLNIFSFASDYIKGNKLSIMFDMSFRSLLVLSGLIAIYAFIYDHNGDLIGRKITLLSVVLSLSSTVLFLTNVIMVSRTKAKQIDEGEHKKNAGQLELVE